MKVFFDRPLHARPSHNAPIWVDVLRFLLCAWLLLWPAQLRAQAASVADPDYVVQPGDTVSAVAARFGADVESLVHLNGLQSPHRLYPGQHLRLYAPGQVDTRSWDVFRAGPDEAFSLLARRAGVPWTTLAQVNRILNPARLLPGQRLRVPLLRDVTSAPAAAPSRVSLALRHNVSFWDMMRLNPQPVYTGTLVLVPTMTVGSHLPPPLVALDMTPQPIARGNTTVVIAKTAVPVTCEVLYLDRVESCYAQDGGTTQVALLGFPPMLDPGRYPVELRLFWEENTVGVPLEIVLGAGRYDYERVDLPPDRQSLLDPERTQAERAKIAALRELRSAERLWEFPFQFPIEASVTSYYGARRSYGYGFSSFHGGTDFRGKTGAPVLAPASGTVILAESLVVRGNAILIDHGWGVVTGYWHLSKIDVTVGQPVAQGERIGAVGNTGLSTGAHLHWELWVNGTSVAPLQWVRPFADFPE